MGRIGTRSAQGLLLLLVVSVVVYAAIVLKLVAIPVIIALIISSAFRPLMRVLHKVMPRTLAAFVSLLAGVLVFGAVVFIVASSITAQFDSLQKSVTEGVDAVVDFANNGPFQIDSGTLSDLQSSVLGFITSSQFAGGAVAGVSTAAELVTGAVLAVILLFYFLKDGPEIWAFLIRPFTPLHQQRAERAGDAAITTLGGYVRGTAIVAAADALCIGVALVILHVPLAIPLAIVVFLGAFVPLVGATVSGIVAALVTLVTVDFGSAIVVVIVVFAVQILEGNFLSPVVLGRSLKLHGIVVLLALTAGTVLGGIVGTLLAVPACAVAWAVIKAWPTPAGTLPVAPRKKIA